MVGDAVDPLAVLGDVPLPYQFTSLSAAATTNTQVMLKLVLLES